MRTCLCGLKNEEAFSPAVPCAWNTWAEGKKICRTKKLFRGAARKWEHVTEWRTKTQETGKNFFRDTGHSDENITVIILSLCLRQKGFCNSAKLAFVGVITGRLCCLVTNQCCHFWCFNVRSDVLWEICEVWCLGDKFDLDWAKLFLF